MNIDTFFENFALFAGAPNAVDKMRELVLELAVQGKLVEQDPNDEPAQLLLGRINDEKVARGSKADVVETSGPFAIPGTWCWVGATAPAAQIPDRGRKINTKDVLETGAYPVVDQGQTFIRGFFNDPERVIQVKEPIVLFGDHTRETKFIDFDFIVGADGVKLLQPIGIYPEYYFLTLRWLPLESRGYGRHYKLLRAASIPLPPLAEQKRIVAKVDALMALCDRLEAQQRERDGRHAELARASVSRFNEDPTPANLKLLFHPACPIDPADLRKTILTLAVRGKLVSQDPADEGVSETFQSIVCFDRSSREITNPPSQWEFTTYRNLTNLVTSGSRGWKSYYSESGAIFIRTQNIKTDRVILDDVAYVSLPQSTEGQRSRVEVGDILITITGANVTKAARVEYELEEAYISQHIALTRPQWQEMSPWLHLCFISPASARGKLESLAYQPVAKVVHGHFCLDRALFIFHTLRLPSKEMFTCRWAAVPAGSREPFG